MLRRSATSPAFPDVFVFPGGTVDAGDRTVEAHACSPARTARRSGPDLRRDSRDVRGERLLFAGRRWRRSGCARREPSCSRGSARSSTLVRELGVRSTAAALHYFARRITPPSATHRFDARFFVARAPEDQVAEADAFETYDGRWVRPAAMLAAAQRGEVRLASPTARYLERIRNVADVAALIALADGQALAAIDAPPARPSLRAR